ncbi:hypothetical protein [Paludisphaera borealis]|uniref:Uncharacterized protein n=1 Tax=Paludisphaera borealis TaxID=1387353 RepID=A0A1U7CJJ9_9BACT|nr:hypothetical protein [Paludisphaera borealis]APW59086.1 hypothetical protein BSF38_00500 [Paludisphaera borealis]
MPSDDPASGEPRNQEDVMRRSEALKGFYGLLESVRERPGIYLGHKSLQRFDSWLHGYRHARWGLGIAQTSEEQEFDEFDAFVQRKYDWRDVGGWAAKIAYYHCDDADAFDEFFKLLDEFREENRPRSR